MISASVSLKTSKLVPSSPLVYGTFTSTRSSLDKSSSLSNSSTRGVVILVGIVLVRVILELVNLMDMVPALKL